MRVLLVHLNVTVPDDDGRPTNEIIDAVEAALVVGSDDDSVRDLEIVIAMTDVLEEST